MATLALQNARVATGKTITYAAASAGGDKVSPASNVYLAVRNASAGAITVTLDATGLVFNGQGVPDTTVSVPASGDVLIPVTPEYSAASDGLAAITYSAVTSVTVAALAV